MNRTTLHLLAVYLWNLPDDYEHFDMMYFYQGQNQYDPPPSTVADKTINHCGTAACAVGHGPSLGRIKDKAFAIFKPIEGMFEKTYTDFTGETYKAQEYEGWTDYCERVFGIEGGDEEFEWCFGGSWSDIDNTPKGAAKRIAYMLKHGIPGDFDGDPSESDVEIYKNTRVTW